MSNFGAFNKRGQVIGATSGGIRRLDSSTDVIDDYFFVDLKPTRNGSRRINVTSHYQSLFSGAKGRGTKKEGIEQLEELEATPGGNKSKMQDQVGGKKALSQTALRNLLMQTSGSKVSRLKKNLEEETLPTSPAVYGLVGNGSVTNADKNFRQSKAYEEKLKKRRKEWEQRNQRSEFL
jgi:hypothetical protein